MSPDQGDSIHDGEVNLKADTRLKRVRDALDLKSHAGLADNAGLLLEQKHLRVFAQLLGLSSARVTRHKSPYGAAGAGVRLPVAPGGLRCCASRFSSFSRCREPCRDALCAVA